ncbi:hypothetical protein RhiirC2_780517 [Rhizophagus irregularis]|uniref:Uncharacterized protein n=1 Tax=Rhizophagus irregularis TaxID=588596 RepID=A0A2N1N7J9_9GLOM|nr:hypothetical protein RhiirC2_780517 [Rhizophagus irregularis]
MENFKLLSYAFVHFECVDDKNQFFNNLGGKRILLNEENHVAVQFQPVKRNEPSNKNKNDSVGRGPSYNLYDNGGEHREINFSGKALKNFIPSGKFEYKILLPTKIDPSSKVNIEWVEEFNLYKIELTKSEPNKRRKLFFD